MTKFKNTRTAEYLKGIEETANLESKEDELTIKCKFNFAYYTEQPSGQSINDLDVTDLKDLMSKLVEFSKKPLDYWLNNRAGGGRSLVIYKAFPKVSEFTNPKHVPHQAWWGRFRIGKRKRLIGFVIPNEYHKNHHQKTGEPFDCNTFYVVFIDNNHKFAPRQD
jgi:hypothetical protein